MDVLSVPIFKAGITLVSSTFYGLFLALFILSTLILNRQFKKTGSQMSSTNVYLVSSYMMFIVLTTVWIISAVMCFNPQLDHLPPSGFTTLMFVQDIVGYLASFIGDFVMIYRLYVIWDQKKIILWIGGVLGLIAIGLTITVVVHFTQTHSIFATLNMILVGGTICINITTTSLIARAVWKQTELTRAVGGAKIIYKLIIIIVESSALYTIWMLSYMISHFTNWGASQIFLFGMAHVAGIASMLINVRVGLGWAVGEEGRSVRSFHNSVLVDSHPDRGSVDF